MKKKLSCLIDMCYFGIESLQSSWKEACDVAECSKSAHVLLLIVCSPLKMLFICLDLLADVCLLV